jgi:hypothetical protein
MKTVEIEFMKNNSIDNWKAEHILTARRLVSALCLIKYNYAIISASQEEIVNRFIKLLIERFNKNFQELATEARKIKLSE